MSHVQTSVTIADVEQVVNRHYHVLIGPVKCCLAVCGSMALEKRTKPLCVILETASGYGKTAVLQMFFPTGPRLQPFIYRSDKFTPKAFVSHASNIQRRDLPRIDLLPKLKDKTLITKELAPIFRGREEEMRENFGVLVSVLDGKGFTSDTGAQGKRGYEEAIVFNWLGATTPVPHKTHKMMSQLGTRLLFYEGGPPLMPTDDELLEYAENGNPALAESECQQVVSAFLGAFFEQHPVGSVSPDAVVIDREALRQIVRWARFVASARAEIRFEKDESREWEPICALTPEGPYKLIEYFKQLARGHALVHGRMEIEQTDLQLVSEVALSSVPGHLRPIVRALRTQATADSSQSMQVCGVSAPTARRYLQQLALLGLVTVEKGSSQTNQPDTATLQKEYLWLRP